MDLCERKNDLVVRHPWELARLTAIRRLLKNILIEERDCRVLDVGCGDGFISRELFKNIDVESITGIDTNLTDEEVSDFNTSSNNVTYFNDYSSITQNNYQLMLLLDVIEHVEDDKFFLRDIAKKYIVDNGYIVITAPAFQILFGSHDKFLKHHRRYNRKDLVDLVNHAKLECLASGYFFLSLLPLRFVQLFCEKIVRNEGGKQTGIGRWNHRKWVTKAIELALNEDARISLALNKFGVVLPGLTVWAVCRKPLS